MSYTVNIEQFRLTFCEFLHHFSQKLATFPPLFTKTHLFSHIFNIFFVGVAVIHPFSAISF